MSSDERHKLDAEALFDKAIDAYEREKYDDAINTLERLLSEYASDVETWNVHYWLGRAFHGKLDYSNAVIHLNKAFKSASRREPDACMFDICSKLASAYWRCDEDQRAVRYFELADSYLSFYEGAKWANERYIYRLGKGRAYVYVGRYKDAVAEFEKARQELADLTGDTEADCALIGFELARARQYLGDDEQAVVLLRKVDARNLPADHIDDYRYIFGKALYSTKAYPEAWEQTSRIDVASLEESFKSNVYNLLGKICFRRGDNAQAKKYLALSLKYEAKESWVHANSAEFLAALGEIK